LTFPFIEVELSVWRAREYGGPSAEANCASSAESVAATRSRVIVCVVPEVIIERHNTKCIPTRPYASVLVMRCVIGAKPRGQCTELRKLRLVQGLGLGNMVRLIKGPHASSNAIDLPELIGQMHASLCSHAWPGCRFPQYLHGIVEPLTFRPHLSCSLRRSRGTWKSRHSAMMWFMASRPQGRPMEGRH
jgi:hypothetical protein